MTMKNQQLIHDFKRLIHVLSISKRNPVAYDDITLYRAEVHILEIIGNSANTTVTDIARDLGVTKGAISQIVSKLYSKEIIRKKEIPNSNRQELSLTPRGKSIFKAHAQRERDLIESVDNKLEMLSTREIDIFRDILNSVTEFIQQHSDKG